MVVRRTAARRTAMDKWDQLRSRWQCVRDSSSRDTVSPIEEVFGSGGSWGSSRPKCVQLGAWTSACGESSGVDAIVAQVDGGSMRLLRQKGGERKVSACSSVTRHRAALVHVREEFRRVCEKRRACA